MDPINRAGQGTGDRASPIIKEAGQCFVVLQRALEPCREAVEDFHADVRVLKIREDGACVV